VAALDLGEGLGGEVVMIEGELALAAREGAALAPARDLGDEVAGSGQLDVHLQALLEGRNGAQQAVALGFQLDVEVDGAGPPADEHRGGAPGEVEARVALGLGAQLAHEAQHALAIYRPAHSSARSQLTRRRIKAL
jgi:hypothetical protein